MARKRSVTIDIVTDEKDAVRGLQRLRGQAEVTESGFRRFGKGVAAAVGVVATGAVAQFSLNMARRGAENITTLKKVDTVFGDSAGKVKQWADSNNEAFGTSETKLAGLAAGFGDLLVPLGFARGEVAEIAPEALEAANAFSLFSPEVGTAADAVRDIGAAVTGEREGLKKWGVVIDEAKVKAELAARGQDKLTGAARDQAEAVATLDLIYRQGADAIGQYEKEGAGALTQQRELEAAAEELKDQLAALATNMTPLIGLFADLTSGVADFFARSSPQQVQALTDRYKELGVAVDEATVAIGVGADHMDDFKEILGDTGLTMDDVTEAVAGGEAGLEEFRRKVAEAGKEAGLSDIEMMGLVKAVEDVAEEHDEAASAAKRQKEAERRAGDQAEIADKQMQGLRSSVQDAADATRDHTAAMEEQADPALRAIRAAGDLREAVDKVNQLQAEGKENTAEYKEALLRLVDAQGRANAAGRTFAEEGGAQSITALIRLMEQAGLSRQEIDRLIADIGRLNATTIKPKAARIFTTSAGARLEAFQHGGVVPGRPGQPRLIVAHGGERFGGSPGTHAARSSVGGGGGLRLEIPIVVDGRVLAKATAEYTREELARLATRHGG